MRKLNKNGEPRKKPGPKPKSGTLASVTAGADALAVCIQAYEAAPDEKAAAAAYRRAMPPLQTVTVSQWAGIVAQGMARKAFTGKEASTMLYAAQIANTK